MITSRGTRRAVGFAVSLLALLGLAQSARSDMLYAIQDDTRNLIRVDPTTLTVTTVGATGIADGDFGDLAYDAGAGVMYWVAGRGNDSLYTIDLNTGAASLVGSHGVNDMFALGYDGTNLYGQSTSGSVYRLDENTGVATAIGSNGVYPGGYTWNSTTHQMVMLAAGSSNFYSVNLSDGSTTALGGDGNFVNDNDLAYDAGRGVYWAMDWSGNLFRYDATTYVRTSMLTGLGEIASVAYVPTAVPEPSTLAMAALGAAVVVGWTRFRTTRDRRAS